MLDTKTPVDIDNYKVDDVYKLVLDGEAAKGLPSPKVRLRVIKMVFDILGYDLSADLALALTAEPQSQLILAPAGGGKTTGTQVKAICEKFWRKSKINTNEPMRGNNILCLVYNRHNIKPMEDKHRELVQRLKLANIKGFDIDDSINAATMHSFCDEWRKEYVALLGLMNYTLLTDGEDERLIQTVVGKVFQKYNINKPNNANTILALHNLAKESMCSISDLENSDKFIDLDLEPEVLEEISTLYEKMKKIKKKYDFTDMLVSVYKLFENHPEIVSRVQKYYDYIIADEVQDFTPIMMKILHILVSDGTPLMCIGDDDQSIYKFRGADIYHTLHFSEEFENGEVYLLSNNRRCRQNILDLAKKIIDENQLRYKKRMHCIKPDGVIEYIPYTSIEGENLSLLNKIKALPESILDDSVICYRERVSSIMIAEMLEEQKIPFNVIGGFGAFSHELYHHVIHVLNLLESPLDPFSLLNLYKCTPLKKAQVHEALGFNSSSGRFKDDEKRHFATLDFGSAMNIKGFDKDLARLTEISNNIDSAPLNTYFDTLFQMMKKFFWTYQKNVRGLPEEYDRFIEDKIYKIFNVNKTYKEVFQEYNKRKELCMKNQKYRYGIAISTFHGLKGLEFGNVYIIDLDNSIFPNFSLIDSKSYDDSTKQVLKECETCLYYVAVTRAKNNLFLYYNEENPSRYVSLYYDKLADSNSDAVISQHNMNYMRLFEKEVIKEDIASDFDEEVVLDEDFEVFDFKGTQVNSNKSSLTIEDTANTVQDIISDDSTIEENENASIDLLQNMETQPGSSSGTKWFSFMNNILDF